MKPDDDNTNEPDRRSHRLRNVVAVVLVLVVLYPLSYGPVMWLSYHGYLKAVSEHFIIAVYKPTEVMIEPLPDPIRRAYFDYMLWWSDL